MVAGTSRGFVEKCFLCYSAFFFDDTVRSTVRRYRVDGVFMGRIRPRVLRIGLDF